MLGHKRHDSFKLAPGEPSLAIPVLTDERIAIDLFHVDRFVRLVQEAFPIFRKFPLHEIGLLVIRAVAPFPVVVAEHKQLLHLPAVCSVITGEHLEPGIGKSLKLLHKTVVGYISRDHHSIYALGAEPFKGMAEIRATLTAVFRSRACADMHVGKNPEREPRLS